MTPREVRALIRRPHRRIARVIPPRPVDAPCFDRLARQPPSEAVVVAADQRVRGLSRPSHSSVRRFSLRGATRRAKSRYRANSSSVLRAQRPQRLILRLPLAIVPASPRLRRPCHHMPLAAPERDAEAEDQRLPLGDVVGPLVERLTSFLKEPSLSWTVRRVTGPDSARRRRRGWSRASSTGSILPQPLTGHAR